MIVFDEESHTYTNSETKERYISVTTLISNYKPYFDKHKHSLRVAEREGVTQEMILEDWEKENRKATTKGTKIHQLMENYIKNGTREPNYDWMFKSYDRISDLHVSKYKRVLNENLLSNDQYKIAGTADLIYDHGDCFTIGDFKTNKRFNYTSSYNEWFSYPVSHLSYCEFNTYALQLSLYAFMYQEATSKQCRDLIVYYLKEDNWQPIHCNFLIKDVKEMLQHNLFKDK